MGVLFDYFAAISDDVAASTIDWVGGPGTAPRVVAPPRRRGFLRRRSATGANEVASDSTVGRPLPTVDGKGIDPVVLIGQLEAQLTGRTYEAVAASVGEPLAVRGGGERLVVRLNDSMVDALATSTDEVLAAAAVPWSRAEEFWDRGDIDDLAHFLVDLARLARHTRSRGEHMYCWVCV